MLNIKIRIKRKKIIKIIIIIIISQIIFKVNYIVNYNKIKAIYQFLKLIFILKEQINLRKEIKNKLASFTWDIILLIIFLVDVILFWVKI